MGNWIPWMKEYEVGVAEIDEQHRELFRMFNDLMDVVWDGKGKDAINETLAFTADYAVKHFATEERHMQHYNYPAFIAHKSLHDAFTQDVVTFLKTYESQGASTEMVVSVISHLGNWTREHIRDMDQDLGKFLSRALAEN
jgi:hemerythrin